MNFRAILRVLTWVTLSVTLSFLVCGTCDVFVFKNTETSQGWQQCLKISGLTTILFFLTSLKSSAEIFRREALASVGLGWILACLLGSLPYMLITQSSLTSSIFESTSGITTTGISVFKNPEDLTQGILLWRAISQWIGGLGIATLFIAMTNSIHSSSKKLFTNESSGNISNYDSVKTQKTAFDIFKIYLFLTFLCFLSLKCCKMSFFDSICYTFSTVSTGGFSTHTGSISFFNSRKVEIVLMIFMCLSGIDFSIFLNLKQKIFSKIKENEELKAYIVFIIVASIICSIILRQTQKSWDCCLFESFFQNISGLTSTGFSTSDFSLWPIACSIILMVLMACGGCTGSTSGGLKIARIIIVFKSMKSSLVHIFRPKFIKEIFLNGRPIDAFEKESTNNFCVLYLFSAIIFLMIFVLLEPRMEFSSSIFTVISLFSNAGMIPSDISVNDLHDHTKLISSLMMILGRIEFYAILLLFIPSFWKKYQ